jgi:hypothetical protein
MTCLLRVIIGSAFLFGTIAPANGQQMRSQTAHPLNHLGYYQQRSAYQQWAVYQAMAAQAAAYQQLATLQELTYLQRLLSPMPTAFFQTPIQFVPIVVAAPTVTASQSRDRTTDDMYRAEGARLDRIRDEFMRSNQSNTRTPQSQSDAEEYVELRKRTSSSPHNSVIQNRETINRSAPIGSSQATLPSQTKAVSLSTNGALPALPDNVEGTVQATEGNLIAISAGSHNGLAKGHILEAYRLTPSPTYLGKVRIVRVTPELALAETLSQKAVIFHKGDKVASKLSP